MIQPNENQKEGDALIFQDVKSLKLLYSNNFSKHFIIY